MKERGEVWKPRVDIFEYYSVGTNAAAVEVGALEVGIANGWR